MTAGSMTHTRTGLTGLVGTVVLAVGLWFFSFAVPWGNFWLKISVSVTILAGLSVGRPWKETHLTRPAWQDLGLGLLCAGCLYLIFQVGHGVSTLLFPGAMDQVGQVYTRSHEVPDWAVACLALFVTGPGEEVYWRGYLQGRLMTRFGKTRGWLAATILYGAVHIGSFNPMLVVGATVAGACWGGMFLRYGRLWPVILCHSLWSAAVFGLFPLV